MRAKVRFDFIFGNDCKISRFINISPICLQYWKKSWIYIIYENRNHLLLECSTYNGKRDILQIELQNIHPNMTISEIIIIGGDLTSIKDKNH